MTRFLFIGLLGLLVACDASDPVANEASNGGAIPVDAPAAPAPDPVAGPPANSRPAGSPSLPLAATAIPALLHGRWGMTPGDCTSTRGDAKGLLIVAANGLKFYESRAVPTARVTTAPDSVSGDFAFTGEGQSWTRFEALERRRDGLVRTERNPDSSFTYSKCE